MEVTKLKKLLEMGRQFAENRVLDPLLKRAMGMALDFVRAEYGYLVLLGEADKLVFRVGQDKDGNALPKPQEQISRTILNEVITTKKAQITADAITSFDASSVLDLKIRSVICVPLISRGKLLGALYVENRSESNLFDEDDLMLLEYFAAQVAVSIENAMLNDELEARVEERTAKLAHANVKLQELAVIDFLTGIYNRRHFFDLAEKELARTRRYHRPLAIIMFDLDRFKQVNDQHGHLAGDQVLQSVVRRIRACVRVTDILGRYGGDEFVIMLPETPLYDAERIAERMHQTIAVQPIEVGETKIAVTISVGITSMDEVESISLTAMIDRADQALYVAKQAGRNQIIAWTER
ncbi:MAG: sensor domain-containing diguanylate cyclase [Gammaproteobacteria bacterium]|nr:sensor domain-containing diguanylate cyclase [Gammaproteobacteria bacterium]